MTRIYQYLATYGLQVIAAAIIFFVGKWLAKLLANLLQKGLLKANVETTLAKFARTVCYVALMVFVIIAALGRLGVETTQFAIVVGAAGLAIGLAWQGSLANLAAGILMMILRPFKVGDFVEIAGKKGTVREIQLLSTIINSPDNIKIIVPNSKITGDNILNYTANGTRRVDMIASISYEDDLQKAKNLIEKILDSNDKILKDPAATVAVSELADNGVNLAVRPWVNAEDYWQVFFETTERIKLTLEQNGITIPYPQRDIRVKSDLHLEPAAGMHLSEHK